MELTRLTPFVAVLPLAGCATTQQMDQTNQQLTQMHQDLTVMSSQLAALQKPPAGPHPTAPRVCYLDGQPYNQGAVVAGRICSELGGVYPPGEPRALGWQLNMGSRN